MDQPISNDPNKSHSTETNESKAGKLPGISKESERTTVRSTPVEFSLSTMFLRHMFSEGTQLLSGGGIDVVEIKNLIAQFNLQHPGNKVYFNINSFEKLASVEGNAVAINRDEIFKALGLTDEELAFEKSKPFQKFLLSNAKSILTEGGITIAELQKAASSWNLMNRNNPEKWVKISMNGFLKIALLDESKDRSGQLTINKRELEFVALGKHHQSVDPLLSRWEKHWPKELAFSYESFLKALDLHQQVVKSNDGKPIELSEATRQVSELTLVTNFDGRLTTAQREEHEINELNPFKEKEFLSKSRKDAYLKEEKFFKAALAYHEFEKGKKLSGPELQQFRKAFQADRNIAGIASIPVDLFGKLTGVSAADAPFAYAALRFVSGSITLPALLAKQNQLASSDISRYLKDVWKESPSTIIDFAKAINVLDRDPSVSSADRFERSLNLLALAAGKAFTFKNAAGIVVRGLKNTSAAIEIIKTSPNGILHFKIAGQAFQAHSVKEFETILNSQAPFAASQPQKSSSIITPKHKTDLEIRLQNSEVIPSSRKMEFLKQLEMKYDGVSTYCLHIDTIRFDRYELRRDGVLFTTINVEHGLSIEPHILSEMVWQRAQVKSAVADIFGRLHGKEFGMKVANKLRETQIYILADDTKVTIGTPFAGFANPVTKSVFVREGYLLNHTLSHELIHSAQFYAGELLGVPSKESILSYSGLNEALTERLGASAAHWVPEGYPAYRVIADILESKVGSKALMDCYSTQTVKPLADALNIEFGADIASQIVSALRTRKDQHYSIKDHVSRFREVLKAHPELKQSVSKEMLDFLKDQSSGGHVNTAKLDSIIQNEFKKYYKNLQTFEQTQRKINNHPLSGVEGKRPIAPEVVAGGALFLLLVTTAGLIGAIKQDRQQAQEQSERISSRRPKTNE
jgi:hypothetical protein